MTDVKKHLRPEEWERYKYYIHDGRNLDGSRNKDTDVWKGEIQDLESLATCRVLINEAIDFAQHRPGCSSPEGSGCNCGYVEWR